VEIIKWGILLTLVIPVPFILGMIPVNYMESSLKTPAMTYVCGWFVSFFIFEIMAIPFIALQKSFTMLVIAYSSILGIVLAASLYLGRGLWKKYREWICDFIKSPTIVKALWALAILIIIFQMVYAVFYEYYDGDDAYYIAVSVATKTYDSMYVTNPYTGYASELDMRHAFSPTPIYEAWLSRLSHIAPAIVAHSVLAPIWLGFMYCIYAQIGKKLLKQRRKYQPVFLLLIAVWFMFGNVSLYTSETFAITRTWQGKGLMAGMVIPALMLCLLYLADKADKGIWILLVCVCMSAAFATSVSFMLIPTIVGLASLIIGIRKKSLVYMIKIFACCIPCLAVAACYVYMG
jgi:hypothetical protein